MLAKTHFALTFFLSYLLFYYLFYFDKISSLILSFLVASFSSIPDIDWKIYSWANKRKLKLEKTKLKYLLFPYYLFLISLMKTFKHRTTTHSIFFALLFLILSYFSKLFLILFLSVIFHIFEDMFTVSGVPLFYPISKKKFAIPVINTRKDLGKQKFLEIISYILLIILFILG